MKIDGAILGIGITNFIIAHIISMAFLILAVFKVHYSILLIFIIFSTMNFIFGIINFKRAFSEQKGGNDGKSNRKKHS